MRAGVRYCFPDFIFAFVFMICPCAVNRTSQTNQSIVLGERSSGDFLQILRFAGDLGRVEWCRAYGLCASDHVFYVFYVFHCQVSVCVDSNESNELVDRGGLGGLRGRARRVSSV